MVIAVAMRLIAERGAAGLSMRSLAAALGVTPMALYNHVRNKDELIDAMLDEALGRVEVPTARDAVIVVRGIMLSTYDVLIEHRDLVPLYLERRGARGANATTLGEKIHEALGSLNIDREWAQRILRALIIETIGFAAFGAVPSDPPDIRAAFVDSLDWTLKGALSSAPHHAKTPLSTGTSDALATVASLIPSLRQARPSNRRLGETIAREGRVDFQLEGTRVIAAVTGPAGTTRRKVSFEEKQGAVRWSCTCTRSPSPWCKHAVAAVIAAAGKSEGASK